MTHIEKHAYEEFYRYHEFKRADGKGWLTIGETITGTPTVAVREKTGNKDMSASMVSNISVSDSTRVKYTLKAGTVGKLYIISIRVVTSTGQKFEDDWN